MTFGLPTGRSINTAGKPKIYFPTHARHYTKKSPKAPRSSFSLLIQITTGQNNLNHITHKIDPTHTDQCYFCEEDKETFIHLLNECPVYHSHWLTLLKGSVVGGTTDWDPRTLVKFTNHADIEAALLSRDTGQ